MTPLETQELARLEQTIQHGLSSFMAVGAALQRIKDKHLYRATHETFDAYCRDKWGMTRSRAYQLTQGSTIAAAIPDASLRPVNESQARALSHFPPDMHPTIMDGVHQYSASTGKPVTAGMIERTGSILSEFRTTGHIDIGNGTSTALHAALSASEQEALQRQRQYQREHYATHDAQSKRRSPATALDILRMKFNSFIKAQPCCNCGALGDTEVAHVRVLLSPKTGDVLPRRKGIAILGAIPLCVHCHRTGPLSIHSVGEQGFSSAKRQGFIEQVAATMLAEFLVELTQVGDIE